MSTTLKRLPIDHTAAAEGRRLAADPNIVSVGFGLKFVGGKPTMEVALHYYVHEKFTAASRCRSRSRATRPT
jgi:hypothetical protein